MKTMAMLGLGLVLAGSLARGATPEELLQAVDQMTPEQAYAFSEKLDAKLWQGVPEGFFTRMAIDFGVSGSTLDTVDLGGVSLSSSDLDLEDVGGFDVGILWQAFHPRMRLGLRFTGWSATDSNLGDAGYSRVDLTGGELLAAAHVAWVRSKSWILWTELDAGVGSIILDTIDTPAGDATTLRRFDGDYGVGVLQAGAMWRFNPALAIQLSGGYRFAESVTLEEGTRESTPELDASGPLARIGLGVNF